MDGCREFVKPRLVLPSSDVEAPLSGAFLPTNRCELVNAACRAAKDGIGFFSYERRYEIAG